MNGSRSVARAPKSFSPASAAKLLFAPQLLFLSLVKLLPQCELAQSASQNHPTRPWHQQITIRD